MNAEDKTARLGAVYKAESTDDVARVYDSWAEKYDDDMSLAGYRHPAISLALLARHVPKGGGPLLDACSLGTGLIGEWLAITGYGDVDALDISAKHAGCGGAEKCLQGTAPGSAWLDAAFR